MAESVVDSLGRELQEVDREYSSDFAGHSRLTRDVTQLDRMIKRVESVVKRVDQVPAAARGAELSRIRDAASQSLTLYQNERTAIVRAQDAGPSFEQFSVEATNANLTFARYARHFAGKDRSTRDLALLGELVEDLKQIDKRMTALLQERKTADFERDRTIVRDNLAQYQKEIDLVEKAQKGTNPEEEASILASLANNQFAVYQTHFAGESRVSRRPALLMRVVGSLKKVRERMIALRDGGLTVEFNGKNIGIVEDRLSVYENELNEIRKLRQATSMTDIMGELGGAANKLFDEYRAGFADKARTQVDEQKLAGICDKLGEIRRQMVEMSWAEDNDMNNRNLDIVTEQITMFEGEYDAVLRAKSTSKTSG